MVATPYALIMILPAPEASWGWNFDPINNLQVDLYHQLDLHLNELVGVDIRWFLADGFDTRWIPRRCSSGLRGIWMIL